MNPLNLYAIANLKNKTLMTLDGTWVSIKKSRTALRSVCWFSDFDEARDSCAALSAGNYTVVTDKTIRRIMGIRKMPEYVLANSHLATVLPRPVVNVALENDVVGTVSDMTPDGVETVEAGHGTTPKGLPLEMHVRTEVGESEIIKELSEELHFMKDARDRWANRQRQILASLQEVEKQEVDILHAVEFYTPDANTKAEAYEQLHDVRVSRRRLKNELSAIASAMQAFKSISAQECSRAMKNIDMLRTQRYRCRSFLEDDAPSWIQEAE